MPYRHNEEWRMRILLSVAWQETQPVKKCTEEGERFACFVHHLDGEGLIQVDRILPASGDKRTYRFDKYGGLKGVFEARADGSDDLIYDRLSGFGRAHRHETECECSAMIAQLEQILTEEEEREYYL